MDERDSRIVEILRANARTSIARLSEAVSLSRTAIRHRLKKLEDAQVIRGYTIVTASKTPSPITVLVLIKMEAKAFSDVVRAVRNFPGIRTAWSLGGEYDLALRVNAVTLREIEATTQKIMALDGVRRTRTLTAFETLFDR